MNASHPLDRVVDVQPGRRATAIRHVPHTLDVFATHFPRFPVLPGVLLLDDIAAVAGIAAGGPTGAWTLARATRIRFRHYVQPGDSVQITVDVVRPADDDTSPAEPDVAICRASVSVDGRPVAQVGELRMSRRREAS